MTSKPDIIYVRASHSVPGDIPSREENTEFTFTVRQPVEVTVRVTPAAKEFHTQRAAAISDELWKALQTDVRDADELPKPLQVELGALREPLYDASRRVIDLLRVFLRLDGLGNIMGAKPPEWSADQESWKWLPSSARAYTKSSVRDGLEAHTAKYFQSLLDDDFVPFLGFEHLARARRDTHDRSKCIDAAIAAELAIKECLVRVEPKLGALITEVPSPPMHKLYGVLLKHYSGKPLSPTSRVDKLGQTRNRLLHRIEAASKEDGEDSVEAAAEALHHLFTVMRPKDEQGAELLSARRQGKWFEIGSKRPGEPTLARRSNRKAKS